MYKKTLLIVAMILICSTASASDTDWSWQFGLGSYSAYFGTGASASDNAETQDSKITSQRYWYVGSYHENAVDGWTGDTGFYSTDIRAPLALTVGQSKTWTFYMWSDPMSSSNMLALMWGWNFPAVPAFDKMEYRLTYVKAADGVTGGYYSVGTSILLNKNSQGTWSFPEYRTEDGRTGYMFELTATVIPEPSSLAALGFGLVPMAAVVRLRRRKG